MGRSIHVPDMYKEKHPKEYAEKFPQKKKEPDNLTPSERLRLDVEKEPKTEEPKTEEPKTEEPKESKKKKKK